MNPPRKAAGRLSQGDHEAYRDALLRTGALGPGGPAVQRHQLPGQGEPKPGELRSVPLKFALENFALIKFAPVPATPCCGGPPSMLMREKKAAGPQGFRRFCFYQPADRCMNHLALRAFGTNV